MEEQFQMLFDKMKLEMQKQTADLKESLTQNYRDYMDEKLNPVIEENQQLKQKITNLEKEIEYLKRDKKSNNIIIFGLDETEKSTTELFKSVQETFQGDLNINVEENEVNKLYRLGKNKVENKPRPVLCSFTNGWKKGEIMKCKRSFKKIHVSEDYSKEVLEKRKALQPQLLEERKKGNTAFLKYDRLIVKEPTTDKRKREATTSPQSPSKTHPRKQQMLSSIKTNRKNAFDVLRPRSNSLTNNIHKNQ
ncbi:uncharacterized protein LOC128198910 [Bicyclus anynana]|uniref:Uncharacterized protein LOC128198910 n=1 Tax=Bicyclus anynana TaxID=110368 RepID=A0ABM3LTX9_BICAN|nr:uncharacterized protein LOC128198910 [Bicyclus anynana]